MTNGRTIGKCVYCFSTNSKLTKEHVVPYGLGGNWILKEASCSKCAGLTSALEEHALRHIFLSTRSFYGLRSRHRKLPETASIIGVIDGKEIPLAYPVKKFGSLLCMLDYYLPAYLDKRIYKRGVIIKGSMLLSSQGNSVEEISQYLGVKKLSLRIMFKGNTFERFITKIAYCFSILQYGLDKFSKIYVLPAIREEKDDIGMWFGSKANVEQGKADIEINLREFNKDIIAEVRLFGKLPVPTYVIVVGRLK